jgi:hypothetical protein
MRKFLLAGAATMSLAGAAQAAQLETGSGAIFNRAEPGKAIVRLDTQITVMFGYGDNSNDNAQTTVGGQTVTVKNNNYGMLMYARLYPAFDAQTPGGFRYGGFAEIRANNNTGGTVGVGTAGQRTTNTLYWNRAFGYVGGDSWGTVRFGMTDGPASLMQVGTFQNFADGGWNGSAPGMTVGINAFQFPINGGYEYSSQKIVYLSPNWSGFDFGLSFAPSTATHQGSDGSTVIPGGSARQATSLQATDWNRYTDMFQATARYRGTFGGFGVAINAGYIGSNVVQNVTPGGQQFDGLSIFDGGAEVSYAGFAFGGHVSTGTFNGNMNMSAKGQKTTTVWNLGASYSTGPYTVGFHWINWTRPGIQTAASPASERGTGVAVGGTYAWAPGVRTFVEFVWGEKTEKGTDLRIGNGISDNINGTGLVIGQAFRW